jgi:dihydroneopterin aldolase
MMVIHLHAIRFRGFHGVHEEERILGGEFEVDLSVSFKPGESIISELDQTIDYTRLYDLVKKRMATPTPLLETIATEIASVIQSEYSEIIKISISIKKLYPPVNNFEGSVGVSFEWNK